MGRCGVIQSGSGPQSMRWLWRKKGEVVGEVLDFVEKGSDDVFGALEVGLRKRLCNEFLVSRWYVGHVVAGCNYLSLVGRVLDVVFDMFKL